MQYITIILLLYVLLIIAFSLYVIHHLIGRALRLENRLNEEIGKHYTPLDIDEDGRVSIKSPKK